MARRATARVYRRGDGVCVGEIGVPRDDDDEDVLIRAEAPDGATALTQAANLADTLLQDPLLSAVVPPQAKLAIAATRHLAEAAQVGGGLLRSLWKSIKGPGKRRLAKALMRTTQNVRLSDIGATVVRDHRTGRPRRRTPRRGYTIGPNGQPQPAPQYPGQYPGGGYDPYGQYGGQPPYGPYGAAPPGYGYPPSGGSPMPYGGVPGYGAPPGYGYDPNAYGQYGYNPYLTPFAGGYAAQWSDPFQDPAYLDATFDAFGF